MRIRANALGVVDSVASPVHRSAIRQITNLSICFSKIPISQNSTLFTELWLFFSHAAVEVTQCVRFQDWVESKWNQSQLHNKSQAFF